MTPYYADEWLTVWQGDCRAVMAEMEPESVHCVVTSPPYWGLRDYGTATWVGGDEACGHVERNARNDVGADDLARRAAQYGTGTGSGSDVKPMQFRGTCALCGAVREDGQLGLEPTPEAYVASMVEVFREVRRVLRADGTVWLNLGDSYAANGERGNNNGMGATTMGWPDQRAETLNKAAGTRLPAVRHGLKPKDLVGIPWRVAFALQADGWYLRSDIIWSKPNPMPESVTDRPTKSHEYLFLLSKRATYYFDADAVREASETRPQQRLTTVAEMPGGTGRVAVGAHNPTSSGGAPTKRDKQRATVEHGIGNGHHVAGFNDRWDASEANGKVPLGRNIRSVWTIATQPYPGAHFATFPEALIEPCIKAGSPQLGVVLDPFAGSGTTGRVAQRLGRRAVLIDLSADYLTQAMTRNQDIPLGLETA